MLSFWEKQSLKTYDFTVVGAGIMGLSLAYELRQKFPQVKIVVLERGIFPSGASTRNAGFACFGSPTEILHDIGINGELKTVELVAQRMEGLNILRTRLGNQRMQVTEDNGYELIFNNTLHEDVINNLNRMLLPVFKKHVFVDDTKKVSSFKFSSQVLQLLSCNIEFQIDSGMMMQQYRELLEENNVHVITGANVKKIDGDLIEIHNPSHNFSIRSGKTFVCTNAFITLLYPKIKVKPGRGQILMTKPIKNLPFQGSFHFDSGFYYFRNVGNRLLFGGGRNMDIPGEETHAFERNEMIISDLIEKIRLIILPGIDFEIEHTWQGIMGFSENKLPQVIKIDDFTTYAMACNGMGVALSPYIAKEIVASL